MENNYLIREKPMKALILFALPIIIGNLFQQTYTMADSVIVSRYFGAKDYKKTITAIFTSLISFFILSILLAAVGLLFGRGIMSALNTPADALDMAVEYLNIYFIGLPFLFMYNVLSAMFNALGQSRIPLYFLIFSSLFNIALDFILVTQFAMGVAGVAWATLIAQGVSAVLSFIVLLSKLQSVVNSFGTETLAGFSAAMRIEAICVVPMTGIGNAVSSYTAQNIGAKQENGKTIHKIYIGTSETYYSSK